MLRRGTNWIIPGRARRSIVFTNHHPAPVEPSTNISISFYALHGFIVEVACDDPDVAEAVDLVLGYFGFIRTGDVLREVQVNMAFLKHAPPSTPPPKATRVTTHNGIDVWSDEAHLYFCDGATIATLDPTLGAGCAAIHALMRNEQGLLRPPFVNLVIHSMLVLLRRHACYPLHAAGLARDNVGLLLVGDSDSGKSTQALSLVHQGWHYLSDDSLLLRPTKLGIEALPLRREFGVDEDMAQHFPEITAHWQPYLTRERKRRIDMAALFPGQALDRCTPLILLFPEIVSKPQSRLSPVGRVDVMTALLRQSPLLMVDAETSAAHIDVLELLADQTVAYRLHAGKDLKENPARLSDLLTPLLQSFAVPCKA